MTIIIKYENIKLWANSLYTYLTDYFYWDFIGFKKFYKSFRFSNTAFLEWVGVFLKLLTGMIFQRGSKSEPWCGNENHYHFQNRRRK